jgi:hypothetical protein
LALRSLFHPKLGCNWKGGRNYALHVQEILHVMCHVLCLPFAVMCIVIVVSKIQYHCFIPSRRNQKVSKIQQHCFIPNWREIKKRMKFNTILSSQIGSEIEKWAEFSSIAIGYHSQDLQDLRFTTFDLMKITYIIVHSTWCQGLYWWVP